MPDAVDRINGKADKDAGSIDSYIVESQEGPPRKYYRITESGRKIQKEQESEWRSFSEAINKLINGEEGSK